MTARGITALLSSRLTVAVGVSVGFHVAIFGSLSLVPTTTGESPTHGGPPPLQVELVAAAPAAETTQAQVATSVADGAETTAGEPASAAAAPRTMVAQTAPEAAPTPAVRTGDGKRSERAERSDPGDAPQGDAASESSPSEDALAAAETASGAGVDSSGETVSSPRAVSMSAARATAPDRTPRSSVATATIRSPQPRGPIRPSYPRRARRLGWEGVTVVRATVETDGSPTALRIVASSGYDLLNRAALEAVRSATFYPGLIGASERRRMSVDLRIVFQLVDKESS